MTSNKLSDRLVFKTLTMPSWFGIKTEDTVALQDVFGEFFSETLISDVVQKLLEIENSPDYWMESRVWPYPDVMYLKKMCLLIDEHSPEDWPIEVRTYWLAWLIQHVRQQVGALLYQVYEYNLKQQ